MSKKQKRKCEYDVRRKQYPLNDGYMRYEHYDAVDGIRNPHSYDVSTAIYGKTGMLIGIELEIDAHESHSSELKRCVDRFFNHKCILVTDGSLSEYGVELNFIPMTVLEYNQSKHLFYKLLNELRKIGYIDSKRCGLHVHISRSVLSTNDWEALSRYITFGRARTYFTELSRRAGSSGLERYACFEHSTTNRYHALNLTPRHTCEFRFFRGTLDPRLFFDSVESLISLVTYWGKVRSNQLLRPPTLKQYIAHTSGMYARTGIYLSQLYRCIWPNNSSDKEQRKILAKNRLNRYLQHLELRATSAINSAKRRMHWNDVLGLELLEERTPEKLYTVIVAVKFDGYFDKRIDAYLNSLHLQGEAYAYRGKPVPTQLILSLVDGRPSMKLQ